MKRKDGRGALDLRKVTFRKGIQKFAEGSVLVSFGNTKVICSASVEDKVPPFLRGTGRGWVTAEYALMPRSTETRTTRDSRNGRIPGRTQEIQRVIGRSLRAALDFEALGERTVTLDCDVLEADGGTRTAAITGGFVALSLALKRLKRRKEIERFPLKDYIAAISVGVVNDTVLLDLDFEEDVGAAVDANVVMTGSGRFVEIQGTAEQEPFTHRDLLRMIEAAKKGIVELVAIQKRIVGELA
ncbi:MAG: ribonuclease PH [Deltaproteobacteria bacterium]|nr:ribonuclease PH [Deltaproteobacteria bacterium]NIS76079.1 ribonuclease PH [Deltaproteobacteria bacterium]